MNKEFCVKKQSDLEFKTVAQLPEVFCGTFEECHAFCSQQGAEFMREIEMIYGGYYADDEGVCYYIDYKG
jgi:hypothetical protein